MQNCELPEDVVFQILLLLPVVSLLRFKSVCKYWNALIDNSTFITRHRLFHEEHDDNIIVHSHPNNSWYLLLGEAHLCIDISAHLHHLCDQKVGVLIYGRFLQWLNLHTIRQLTLLPESPVPTPEQGTNDIYGFGYAVKTDCYKVIKLTRMYNHDRGLFDNTRVEIYNLQSDSWRIDNVDINGNFSVHEGVYWNGLYYRSMNHWPTRETFSLAPFDFNEEVLGVVAFPDPDVLSTNWFPCQLVVVSECIAFVDDLGFYNDLGDHYFNIWVLKESGIKESWTKLYTIGPTLGGVIQTGFFSKGDFFFFTLMEEEYEDKYLDKYFLAWCNPIIQEIQYHPFQPAHSITSVFVYKESLVSVKKGNNASSAV